MLARYLYISTMGEAPNVLWVPSILLDVAALLKQEPRLQAFCHHYLMNCTRIIENQDIKIEPGDKVEVKGSRITFSGKPAMIAAESKKGHHILKLRDDNGIPAWSGWRRR
jgi:hypothetical protein